MLKKIRVDQVRLGMHLHALEGAWMDHPFWKTRFVIREADQLKKLQDSVIKEVWIDPEKGLDVTEEVAAAVLVAAPAAAAVPVAAASPVPEMATVGAPDKLPAKPASRPATTSTPVAPPSRSFADEMRTPTVLWGKGKA